MSEVVEQNPVVTRGNDCYARFVNPEFAELLRTFDYGRDFIRAEGTRLFDADGREYLDFLAGFGVHNIGHNHPRLVRALKESLDSLGSSILNIDAPSYRAALAEQLNSLSHPELCRAVFANSGAEAVDIAIKTARLATGRDVIISCSGGYHGLSIGAGSLINDSLYRKGLGTPGVNVRWVPFGDAPALEHICGTEKPAAFILEPVQGEGGIRIPAPEYLREASHICRRLGCLLIVDEIQTGLGRTGRMFATRFKEFCPDILLLGKALSGGIVPIAATMMTAHTWKRSFGSAWACNMNASTFAGGRLATCAAIETLSILQDEGLADAALARGAQLEKELSAIQPRHRVIKAIRQSGLLLGIEFCGAEGLLVKAVPSWARNGLYAQVICAILLRDHGIIVQPCSLAQNVLRVEPPLVVNKEECTRFVAALDQTLQSCPDHGSAVASAFRKKVFGKAL